MAEASRELVAPQNLEAEMAVLGSMMLDEKAIAAVIEILDQGYFALFD